MVIPLMLLVAAATTASFLPPSLTNVRGATPRETALLRELVARSATARALTAQLGAEAVIVYVEIASSMPRGHGATRLAATTPQARFIRITLSRGSHPDDLGALLAHELQHALELARGDVTNSTDVRRLYHAIGDDRSASTSFETAAAQDIGARVRQELSRSPRVKSPS